MRAVAPVCPESAARVLRFGTVRVLLDYRPALRERTGVGEFVHQLARALVRAGTDLTLFSSSWKDRPDPGALAEIGARRVADRRIPVRLLNAAWHRWGWPPVEWLAGGGYDLVHSPHPLLLPSRRAAQVVTVHDLDFLDRPDRAWGEIRRDYPALVRAHALSADAVVVPSRFTGEGVVGRLGVAADRVFVCPLGLPPGWIESAAGGLDGPPLSGGRGVPSVGGPKAAPARRRDAAPGLRARGGYILFVGTLSPRKNIGGLLDGYERLLERRPGAPRLVIAGGAGEGSAEWLERTRRAPLAGHVEYRGYVPAADRRALYEGAALFALPSFNEGFGLPVIEAMALGIPVVVSNRGALPEVAGDAALIVEPDDADRLAEAFDRLLSDQTLASELGARGAVRASTFTWDHTAACVSRAYEAAVRARR